MEDGWWISGLYSGSQIMRWSVKKDRLSINELLEPMGMNYF